MTKAFEDGYKVIRADGSSAKIIKELYQNDNISAMLTLTSSDIDNIYFILNAKGIYKDSVVYTRMNQKDLKSQYLATNVDGYVEPYEVVDKQAFDYLVSHRKENKTEIIFFGYTHKSAHLCKMLENKKINVRIYDISSQAIEDAKKDGFTNVTQIEKYESDINTVENAIVVCAMEDEAINVYRSITLRANGFKGEIVALSDSKEDNRKLYLSGVSKIFDMYEESADLFVKMIENRESIA